MHSAVVHNGKELALSKAIIAQRHQEHRRGDIQIGHGGPSGASKKKQDK